MIIYIDQSMCDRSNTSHLSHLDFLMNTFHSFLKQHVFTRGLLISFLQSDRASASRGRHVGVRLDSGLGFAESRDFIEFSD